MVAVLCCFMLLSSNGSVFAADGNSYSLFDESFNTSNEIVLYGSNAKTAAESIKQELQRLDGIFSLTKDSELKTLNETGQLQNASADAIYLFGRAKQLYAQTDGAFNPATYLLTDLWQLSSRFSDADGNFKEKYDRELYKLPEQKYIDAFKQLLNFEEVQIDGNTIYLPQKSVAVDGDAKLYTMQVDLGGIVKGYAAEQAKKIAASFGITDGYVSLGGSSITFFNNPNSDGGKYSVGVLNPQNVNSYYAVASVKDTTMSTSGNYQPGKYFELDGKRYCHIIDSKTGRPVDSGITTVSILCDDAITADALTTAIMVKGFDSAKEYINGSYFKQNDINAAFVYQKGWLLGNINEVITNTDKDFFDVTDGNFKLCGYVNDDGAFIYNAQNPNLTLFICVAVVVALALIAVAIKKGSGKTKPDLKKQKFFKLSDLAVYATVAVLVVGLFLGFVVFRSQVDLNYIEIYHQNNRIYIYDVATGEGVITDETYADKIEIEKINGKIVVTIKTGNFVNVAEIDGASAKMIEANCSGTKECVNNFGAITNGNQTIICDVAHIKIVGVGDADMPILNG